MLDSFRNAASAVAGFLFLAAVAGLISANIREAAREWGLDTLLLRFTKAIAATPLVGQFLLWCQSMIAGWQPLGLRWLLWLSLGLSLGVAASLWAVSIFQPQTTVDSNARQPLIRSDIVRLLGELPALDGFMDRGQPLSQELAELLRRQPRLITLSMTVADAKSQAAVLQDKFSALRTEFYNYLNSHSYDRDEIYKMIDWNNMQRRRGEEFGVVVVDLGNYVTRLGYIATNATPETILQDQNIWELYVSLSEDQRRFFYWTTDTKARVNTRRHELQAALKDAR